MAVIEVNLAGRPYEVRVEAGLLARCGEECRHLLRKPRVPIVTDVHVHAAWGETVTASLTAAGFEPRWKVLPAGEAIVDSPCRSHRVAAGRRS